MIIIFHKRFTKKLNKLYKKEKNKVSEQVQLFSIDPYHIKLRNHALKGSYSGYRSIDISPDLRAIYKEISQQQVIFVTLGSHSQLY